MYFQIWQSRIVMRIAKRIVVVVDLAEQRNNSSSSHPSLPQTTSLSNAPDTHTFFSHELHRLRPRPQATDSGSTPK